MKKALRLLALAAISPAAYGGVDLPPNAPTEAHVFQAMMIITGLALVFILWWYSRSGKDD